MSIYWMSFCDPDKPEGSQFLGVAIVRAPDEMSAVLASHRLGCNPGGEVQMMPVPEGLAPDDKWMDRLLTAEDAAAIDAELEPRAAAYRASDAFKVDTVNEASRDGLTALCAPIIAAGLDGVQLMIALESLVVGAFLMNVKLGGDEPVIEVFAERLRERMAEQRLGAAEPQGQA